MVQDARGWDKSPDPLYAGRIGFDATKPLDRPGEFERVRTPGSDSLTLSRYVKA